MLNNARLKELISETRLHIKLHESVPVVRNEGRYSGFELTYPSVFPNLT